MAVDKRGIEAARADTSKLKALRDYRRAYGLCFKCGERWGHDHVCPTSIQLHVVEELLDMLDLDNLINTQLPSPSSTSDSVMAISLSATTGGVSTNAFQLHAWIQGRDVLLLMDSGSSNSFIDARLAAALLGVQPLPRPGRVRVADGGEMICSTFIPSCPWYSQGQEFFTDLKVLALGIYDAILGMDWLEEHNPMIVDWRNRFIEISTPTGPLRLEGHDAASAVCESINSVQLQGLYSKRSISHIVHLCVVAPASEPSTPIPECIQRVIDEFLDVFAKPTSLPPRHACDH